MDERFDYDELVHDALAPETNTSITFHLSIAATRAPNHQPAQSQYSVGRLPMRRKHPSARKRPAVYMPTEAEDAAITAAAAVIPMRNHHRCAACQHDADAHVCGRP